MWLGSGVVTPSVFNCVVNMAHTLAARTSAKPPLSSLADVTFIPCLLFSLVLGSVVLGTAVGVFVLLFEAQGKMGFLVVVE